MMNQFKKNQLVYFISNVKDNFFVREGKYVGYNAEHDEYYARIGDEIYFTSESDIFTDLATALKEALNKANKEIDIKAEMEKDRVKQIVDLQERTSALNLELRAMKIDVKKLREWAEKRFIKPLNYYEQV